MIQFKTTKEQLQCICDMLSDVDYMQAGNLQASLLCAVLEHVHLKLRIKLIQLKRRQTTWTLTPSEAIGVLIYFNHLMEKLQPGSFEFSFVAPMRDELGKQLFF